MTMRACGEPFFQGVHFGFVFQVNIVSTLVLRIARYWPFSDVGIAKEGGGVVPKAYLGWVKPA